MTLSKFSQVHGFSRGCGVDLVHWLVLGFSYYQPWLDLGFLAVFGALTTGAAVFFFNRGEYQQRPAYPRPLRLGEAGQDAQGWVRGLLRATCSLSAVYVFVRGAAVSRKVSSNLDVPQVVLLYPSTRA